MGRNKGIEKLVCFGCSFVEGAAIEDKTDQWVGERFSFPTILASKLGTSEFYNYGKSGMGNESMLRRIHWHFNSNTNYENTLVVIGLSGITRLEIYSVYRQRYFDHHLFDYPHNNIEEVNNTYARRAKKWLGNSELTNSFKTYVDIEQKYFFDLKSKQEKLQWQITHLDGYFKNKGIRYVIFNSVEDNIDPIKKNINYMSLVNTQEHKDINLTGLNKIEDTWYNKLRLDHYYNVNKDFNCTKTRSSKPPYGKYFCNGHPSPNAHEEITTNILNYIDENNI